MSLVIKDCISILSKNGTISPEDASAAMKEMMSGDASQSQMGSFLSLLSLEKVTPEIIAALAQEMRKHCVPIAEPDRFGDTMDIVGTGGDGHDTFNVSTATSLILAAAGAKIAKHGNRASSSKCGSTDLLEALGANINLGPEQVTAVIEKTGFCFLFARTFYAAMRHAAPVRKDIGIRTVFNILGPLCNPKKPRYQMLGVYDKSLGRLYAEVSVRLGIERSLIVCGAEGLDELSIAGPSHVWNVENGEIIEGVLHPEKDFGLKCHPLSSCAGGSAEENVEILNSILAGEDSPVADFVILNCSAALVTCGLAENYIDGVRLAKETIKTGKARQLVDDYVKATHQFVY